MRLVNTMWSVPTVHTKILSTSMTSLRLSRLAAYAEYKLVIVKQNNVTLETGKSNPVKHILKTLKGGNSPVLFLAQNQYDFLNFLWKDNFFVKEKVY